MTKRYRLVKSKMELNLKQEVYEPPKGALIMTILLGLLLLLILIFGNGKNLMESIIY